MAGTETIVLAVLKAQQRPITTSEIRRAAAKSGLGADKGAEAFRAAVRRLRRSGRIRVGQRPDGVPAYSVRGYTGGHGGRSPKLQAVNARYMKELAACLERARKFGERNDPEDILDVVAGGEALDGTPEDLKLALETRLERATALNETLEP